MVWKPIKVLLWYAGVLVVIKDLPPVPPPRDLPTSPSSKKIKKKKQCTKVRVRCVKRG